MRKLLLGFVVVLVVSMAAYLRFHRSRRPSEVAYAANREVTLWSSAAQVRAPVAMVGYGDRLDVLDRLQDQVKVRTVGGITGWTTQGNLLSADFWQKAQDLDKRTAALPVEARGHTGVLANMRLGPGRQSPRIRQLGKAVPVELFERQAIDAPPQSPAAGGEQVAAGGEPVPARKEDWWLVRAHLQDEGTISGWVLGRFVDLDVPAPLPDYASTAGMHITAWFELNRAVNTTGNAKPQYLVVGTRGPEGQPCDFTLLRVYTWSKQRQRYETAFVESDVCGKLPVRIAPAARGGDVTFGFEDWSKGTSVQRTYLMRENVVRRLKEPGPALAAEKRTHG